jgi:hypothetical protein
MGEEPDRYLRVTAAARLLGVSRWTLDKHATDWGIRSRVWPGPRRERRYRETDVRDLAQRIADGEFEPGQNE